MGHQPRCHRTEFRPRQNDFDDETQSDHHHQRQNERFDLADAEALQHQQHQGIGGRYQDTDDQGQME